MTSRERYERMIRGEAVDIVPRVPILMQFAAEFVGSDYAAFASDHRILVRANLACADTFGIDQLSAISDPYRETQGFGADIVYVPDGPPRCPHPPLEDSKALDRLPRPDPLGSERMRDRVDAIAAYAAHTGDTRSIMGWIEGPAAEAADLRGVANFLFDLADDEAFAAALMDLCVDVGIAFADAQVAAGADTVGIGDAIASQVSPAMYERLILPRERRLVAAIREMGAWTRLHICGDTTHLLPAIGTLGIDILDLDHMVDLGAARNMVGRGVVLTGNLDPAGRIRFGDPDAIRHAFRGIYGAAGNPYMVNAGCEIPAGTPHANLQAVCEPIPYA